jgi:glutaminyl-peptide cyclotransferase
MHVLIAAMVALTGISTAPTASAEPDPVPVVTPEVLAQYPHDPTAWTEGLEWDGSALYEATGDWGRSDLRRVDLQTGNVLERVPINAAYFGEGITIVDDRIWQLTYQDDVAIEWDKATLTPLREVPTGRELWGLCRDGDRLISSDGTGLLRFHDPATMGELGSIEVTRTDAPVGRLDELECVDGKVWASVWPTDDFVRIDPNTGVVDLVLDASALWRFGERGNAQVMSSIAHLEGDRYLLVGKEWPALFEVRIPS